MAGCWTRPEIPLDAGGSTDWSNVDPASEQTAFEQLKTLDRREFDQAWEKLSRFAYSQSRSISVRDLDGVVVGQAAKTIRISGPADRREVTVISSDSSGSIEQSLWSQFDTQGASETAFEETVWNWPELVLPEDPLFLSERGPSFFRYAAAGDTLIESALVTIFESAVRQDESRQGIQRARLYLHQGSLVGAEILVTQQSFLFHELSSFRIILSPGPGGEWLPAHVALLSTVGLPFSRSRSYEMLVTYSDIRLP